MVLFQRKLQFPKEPEGSIIFQEGGPFFSRVGVQMLISIETNITCDFPEGSGLLPPPPPLDLHINISTTKLLSNAINMYAKSLFTYLWLFGSRLFRKITIYTVKSCVAI